MIKTSFLISSVSYYEDPEKCGRDQGFQALILRQDCTGIHQQTHLLWVAFALLSGDKLAVLELEREASLLRFLAQIGDWLLVHVHLASMRTSMIVVS